MPINDFSENRDFMRPAQDQGINEEAFREFITKCGPDVAKGYIMALNDLLPKIGHISDTPGEARKRKAAWATYDYINGLLHISSDLFPDEPDLNANMPSVTP